MTCILWPWSRHRRHHREEVESLRRETDTARQRRIQAELDLLRANAQRAQSDQTVQRADQAAERALEAVVMWQTTVSIWWDPDYPGRDHVRFVVYTMGALSCMVMLRTLSRAQRTPPGPNVPGRGI